MKNSKVQTITGLARFVGGAGLSVVLLAAAAAWAQEPAVPETMKPVIVTGTLIPTAETVGPAPVDIASAEKITTLGVSDVLQTLKRITPSLSGNLNTGQEINNGGLGESYVAIRNLRTLVMVNGRRLGNSSFSNGQLVDLNTIPLAAIERVEVLKDGASALYGSEAVGGVVNIITKKEYSGVEVSGRYGFATGKGSVAEYGGSIVGGTTTEKSSFLATAQFYHMDPLVTTDRKVSGYGVLDLAAKGVTPPSYMSPSFVGKVDSYILNPDLATPPVTPGTPYQTLAAYRAANPGVYVPISQLPISQALDAYSIYAGTDYEYPLGAYFGYPILDTKQFGTHSIQSQDRQNFFGVADHQIFGERMRVYGEFLYANIESRGVLAPSPVVGLAPKQANINIPANNPYNPFQIDLGPLGGADGLPPNAPRVRHRFVDSGNRLFDAQTDYYHFVGGLKGVIEEKYNYDVGYTYNRYDQIQYTRNAINGAALDLALQPLLDTGGNPVLHPVSGRPLSRLPGTAGFNVPVYNMFSGHLDADGFNDPETLEAIRSTLFQTGVSEEWDVNAVLSGTPFDLPAGAFGFAAGFVFGSESLDLDFDGLTKVGKVPGLNANYPSSGRRDNWAGFGEIRIPVFSPDMDVAAFRSLELNAALRYENFDPGGDSTVPKIGIRWQPLDEQITIRGTYAQSFVAPTTYELFGGSAVNVPALVVPLTDDPDANLGFRQEYTSNLSNRELKPADAENWGVGLVLSPKFVPGLTVSVDYYHIRTDNDIFRVSQQDMVNDLNQFGVNSPWVNYYSKADGSRITTAAVNQANDLTWGNLEVPLLNGAEVRTDGLDFTANYALPTEKAGTFNFFVNANLTLSYEYKDPVSGGFYSYEGQYTDAALGIPGAQGTLPDYIINAGVTWEMPIASDALSVTLNSQYVPEVESLGSLHPSNMAFEQAFDDMMNDYTLDGKSWTVDSWYRVDLQVSYEIGKHRDAKRWFDNTRFTIGCNNITDTQPPLIAASFEDNTDKSTYDILGRFIYFELSKKF